MGKINIVDVRPKPWWKFWTSDNLEVTLEEDGKQRTITVHDLPLFAPALLKECILEKYLTGDQFWSLHLSQKNAPIRARKLIGEKIDGEAYDDITRRLLAETEGGRRVTEKLEKIMEEERDRPEEAEEKITEEHRRTAEEEAQIKSFNELVPAAAELHPMTRCVKNQMSRHTAYLKGEECCQCSHFLMNEGICDPL